VQGIRCIPKGRQTTSNHSYFPILVEDGYTISRDKLYDKLKNENIYARRYFYPLITDFDMYKYLPSASRDNLPVAYKIANQVLCLPIYPNLNLSEVEFIADIIAGNANGN
jgi:dTDP-4-amino-4,6-dideoxygalactose transaminase